MNSAVVRSFVNKSVGNIEEVKRESNDLRNGTMSRIDKMKMDIALIISEYDCDEVQEIQSTCANNSKSKDFTSLSESVRLIKLKNN